MAVVIDKYEDIYIKLKKCFYISFGNSNTPGTISLDKVIKMVMSRSNADYTNNLPKNSLIEIPRNLYSELENTYTSRDESCVSGIIGCAENPGEQLDGITNMALLMYLSNQLAKECKFSAEITSDANEYKLLKKNERGFLKWKDIALSDIIASIYVLSKTSEEYDNYFSYGIGKDKDDQSTFTIDLPYIGQISVHFGWDAKKNNIIQRATDSAESILEEKLKLGQITEVQLEKIKSDLAKNGVLPEYEGKLYEYVAAMPIEYVGRKINNIVKYLGNKLPEEITHADIKKLIEVGDLNERELYYFFIKIGASKEVLNKISGANKKISHKSVEKATDDITIEEFNKATQNLKDLSLGKKNKRKQNPNIRI